MHRNKKVRGRREFRSQRPPLGQCAQALTLRMGVLEVEAGAPEPGSPRMDLCPWVESLP